MKIDDHAVDVLVGEEKAEALPVVLGRRGREHVHRVRDARRRREKGAELLRGCGGQRRQRQPLVLADIRGQDPRSAGVRQDRDAAPLRDGLVREERRDVEELLERRGANDAGLPEERVHDRVRFERARPCARKRRARPPPSVRS